MKKNCLNCIYLDYFEKEGFESYDDSGYLCEKREYRNSSEENNHLDKLNNPNYLEASKKCCELEPNN